MAQLTYPIEQADPNRSPREALPTMYDLPSEDPEEPGLPDEFHILQPQLLSETCRRHRYWPKRMFAGTDINLYYDLRHPLWHKRPDWFLAVDVPYFYDDHDLRLSYVIWQEKAVPLVVVELLSPGTEAEDLGDRYREADLCPVDEATPLANQEIGETPAPPGKWEVYERILQVPYYLVFSRYTDKLRAFRLVAGRYREMKLNPNDPRVWIPELELGFGLWHGEYKFMHRPWLRCYDAERHWIPTEAEEAIQEKQQAVQEKQQLEALLEQERLEKERLLERLKQLEGQVGEADKISKP